MYLRLTSRGGDDSYHVFQEIRHPEGAQRAQRQAPHGRVLITAVLVELRTGGGTSRGESVQKNHF